MEQGQRGGVPADCKGSQWNIWDHLIFVGVVEDGVPSVLGCAWEPCDNAHPAWPEAERLWNAHRQQNSVGQAPKILHILGALQDSDKVSLDKTITHSRYQIKPWWFLKSSFYLHDCILPASLSQCLTAGSKWKLLWILPIYKYNLHGQSKAKKKKKRKIILLAICNYSQMYAFGCAKRISSDINQYITENHA